MARPPASSAAAARAPAGARPHPAAPNSTNHNRTQKPGVPSQQAYGSPGMKYPHHPQSGHYAPPSVGHPGAHAGSPHQHHHHQHHQRMVPSPASRTPSRAAAPPQQPKYAAHTPVAHSQTLIPDPTKAKASPATTSARPSASGASRSPNQQPSKSPPQQQAPPPAQQQQPKPS